MRLIGLKKVVETTGLSRSKLTKLLKEREFPLPVKSGDRIMWHWSEVQEWKESNHDKAAA